MIVILKVKVGDYFSAGGWSGHIRSIRYDNGYPYTSLGAIPGCSISVSISNHKDANEPRPLGDNVYFHRDPFTDGIKGSQKKKNSLALRFSEYIMNQNQYNLKFGNNDTTMD